MSIVKQITLTNSNIDKLNLRLMRAFTYLSQFKLNIKYRSSKEHVILDALSRLFFDNKLTTLYRNSLDDVLDLNNYFCDVLDFFDNSNYYIF